MTGYITTTLMAGDSSEGTFAISNKVAESASGLGQHLTALRQAYGTPALVRSFGPTPLKRMKWVWETVGHDGRRQVTTVWAVRV